MPSPTSCITSMNTTLFNKSLPSRKTIKFKISRNEDPMTFLGNSFQRLRTYIAKNIKAICQILISNN